jgi:dCMP deaminase
MKYTDKEFYDACLYAASKSRCLSRQIGTALGQGGVLLITGWNGPPRGVPPCNEGWYKELSGKDVNGCPRQDMGHKSGEGIEWCIAVHAERSALINAARYGIKTQGCTLYMSCGVPCTPCLVEIIEAEIAEIVLTDDKLFYDVQSKYLLNQAKKNGMIVRTFEGVGLDG